MMPTSDPHLDQVRQLWASALAAIGALVVATAWATTAPSLPAPASPKPDGAGAGEKAGDPLLSSKTWTITLWQPLADAPVVVAATSPLAIKLFSILTQGDGLTAAIDPGDGGPLVYVHPGDTVRGASIVSIDAHGVNVRYGGIAHRLELIP
jgi:hypothetical protein